MKEKGKKPNLELPTTDDKLLWDIWMSVNLFSSLTVADELGIFSFLKKKSATAKELSDSLSLQIRGTEALLGILTSLGFLVHNQNRFHLTGVARTYLLPESPFYWGGMLHTTRNIQNMHSAIKKMLKTDEGYKYKDKKTHFTEKFTETWKKTNLDLEKARIITKAMHSRSFPAAIDVARWGDFTNVNHLLDVGGGSGCFCIALAHQYPEINFTIMDLPAVCKIAEEYISHYNLQDRIDTLPANMFKDEWPSGYDAIFFSNVFHDWSRDRCLSLCKLGFEVLPSGGHIYVHEILLNDTRDGPLTSALYSITMMLVHEGRLFTAKELTELIEECGFKNVSVVPTHPYCSLLSAEKP